MPLDVALSSNVKLIICRCENVRVTKQQWAFVIFSACCLCSFLFIFAQNSTQPSIDRSTINLSHLVLCRWLLLVIWMHFVFSHTHTISKHSRFHSPHSWPRFRAHPMQHTTLLPALELGTPPPFIQMARKIRLRPSSLSRLNTETSAAMILPCAVSTHTEHCVYISAIRRIGDSATRTATAKK